MIDCGIGSKCLRALLIQKSIKRNKKARHKKLGLRALLIQKSIKLYMLLDPVAGSLRALLIQKSIKPADLNGFKTSVV